MASKAENTAYLLFQKLDRQLLMHLHKGHKQFAEAPAYFRHPHHCYHTSNWRSSIRNGTSIKKQQQQSPSGSSHRKTHTAITTVHLINTSMALITVHTEGKRHTMRMITAKKLDFFLRFHLKSITFAPLSILFESVVQSVACSSIDSDREDHLGRRGRDFIGYFTS